MTVSARIVAAVAIAGLVLVGGRYFFLLDPRFHPLSANGAKGFVLYLVGDYVGAAAAYRAHYRAVAGETPGGDPMWKALLAGDISTAKRLAQAAAASPYPRNAWLTLAEIALLEQRPGEALRLATHVLEQERDQFDALLLSAAAHSYQGVWSQAIDDLQRALRHSRIESRITSFLWALETTGRLRGLPVRDRPLCLLAHFHRYLRIFDPWNGHVAIGYAEKAIAAGDRPADAFLTIAIVRDKQGKPQATFEAVMKALEIDPRHPEALRWASKSYSERGDIANEFRMMKSAVEAAPSDPFYLAPLFQILTEKLGDFRQAKLVGEQALRAGIEDGELHRRLGYVHHSLGNYEASLAHCERAVALEPAHPQSHVCLGAALEALGRAREAIVAFERAAQLASYSSEVHVALARAYHHAKRHTEAIAAYERGVQLAMRWGNANYWDVKELCGLYRRVGALEHAEGCLKRLIAFQPGVPFAHRRLAEIRESLQLEQELR